MRVGEQGVGGGRRMGGDEGCRIRTQAADLGCRTDNEGCRREDTGCGRMGEGCGMQDAG